MKPPCIFVSALFVPFLPAQVFTLQTQAMAQAPAFGQYALTDVTNDGHPDLIAGPWVGAHVMVGSSTGITTTSIPMPVLIPGSMNALDSTGDGNLDVWLCSQNVATRLELVGGAFVATASLGPAQSLDCADFNGDGHVDVVMGHSSGLKLLRSNGSGGFLPEIVVDPNPQLMAYTRCYAEDIDGDGNVDIVAAGFPLLTRIWLGTGTGQFSARPSILVPSPYSAVRLADVTGDGLPDLLAPTWELSQEVLLFRNLGGGLFAAPQPIAGFNAREIATADFDGDGHVDLVGINDTGLSLALGSGAGAFAAPIVFPVGYPYGLVVGDLESDGRVEAVAVNAAGLVVLRNSSTFTNLAMFGSGTPPCAGTIGIRGTAEPTLGQSGFRLQCTNVSPGAIGLMAIGTAVPIGWDPLNLGLTMHLASAQLLGGMRGDDGGTASIAVSIPGDANFAGLTVDVQSFWLARPSVGDTCSPALHGISSSRGLSITLVP